MDHINIQLIGGEKDGYRESLEIEAGRPDLVFIWRTEDDQRIQKVKGDARKVLVERLGVLAYKFKDMVTKPEMPGGLEFRYERDPKSDKKVTA